MKWATRWACAARARNAAIARLAFCHEEIPGQNERLLEAAVALEQSPQGIPETIKRRD
jgi:hypothetical protein